LGSVWYLVVYIPTALSRTKASERRKLFHNRLEADLYRFEAIQEITIHIRLSILILSPCRRFGHNSHTGGDLPKRTIQVLVLQNTYLNLVQVVTSAASIAASWYIQRRWKIDIKKMFITVCILETLIPLWGMIGIWTDKFGWDMTYSYIFPLGDDMCIRCGFHNFWEFWVYNFVCGLVVGPNHSISQTMMGELSPPGFEYMIFGLFGLSNRSAAIIGPNVIQAIVDKNGNNWKAFPVRRGGTRRRSGPRSSEGCTVFRI